MALPVVLRCLRRIVEVRAATSGHFPTTTTMPPLVRPKPKKKQQQQPLPTTADEFLDAGTNEEDSGDRWISSGDVPKGVRFYQRAFKHYQTAADKCTTASQQDTNIRNDAFYNMARMQFVVYTKVIKPGILDEIRSKLEQDPGLIEQSIEQIAENHRQAIAQAGGEDQCQIDLLYNYAQVLTEVGDEKDSSHYYSQAWQILDKVLQRQVDQLAQLENLEYDSDQGQGEDQEVFNYGPAAILETLVTFVQCMTVLISEYHQEQAAQKSTWLIDQIFALTEKHSLNNHQIDEARIAIVQNQTCNITDFTALDQQWNQEWLPDSPQRFMAQADAFITLATWQSLSHASKLLSKAQETASSPQIKAKIWIAKGDVERMRGSIPGDANSQKNSQVLLKNASVFYTNACNLQSLNAEFLQLKAEAAVKKALTEGTDTAQFDPVLVARIRDDF